MNDGSIELQEEEEDQSSKRVSTEGSQPQQMTGGLATLFKLLATKKENFRTDANSVAGTMQDLDAFEQPDAEKA